MIVQTPIPILPTKKNQNSKKPGNQNKGCNSNSQTRGYINKNDRAISDHDTTKEIDLQQVDTITTSKFQQEIIQILKRDFHNRRGNLKNHLTKWKNVISDKAILALQKMGLKPDLRDTSKSNSNPSLYSHSHMKRN